MSGDFEVIGPDDKPALLVLSNPEYLEAAQQALGELGYKIHFVGTHEEFPNRYAQVSYQVVVTEERFAGSGLGANETLEFIQLLPMAQRRHTTFILLGDSVTTLNPMQAFTQSVHAVVNTGDLGTLPQIVSKVVAENDSFLYMFRQVTSELARGKG